MKAARVLVVALAAASLGVCARAEEKPGTVALVYSAKPRQGAWMQLDGAMKKHFAWHRTNQDAWGWVVWQVISGPDIGDFVAGTFGHHWKELDARATFDAADEADFMANVMPLVEKIDLGYWSFLPGLSHGSSRMEPAAMAQITHYYVEPDGYVEFTEALKGLRDATPADYPMHFYWYRLVSGGENPQFVLAIDRSSWADMEGQAVTLDKVIADAVGAHKAVALFKTIRDTTRSTRSYMLKYRPDLSYMPAK